MCASNFILSFSTNSTIVDGTDFAKIDIASKTLLLSSSNIKIIGAYLFKISAYEPISGATKDVFFEITIDC